MGVPVALSQMRQHHGRAFQGSLTVIVLSQAERLLTSFSRCSKLAGRQLRCPSNPSHILPMHKTKKSQASPKIKEKLGLIVKEKLQQIKFLHLFCHYHFQLKLFFYLPHLEYNQYFLQDHKFVRY